MLDNELVLEAAHTPFTSLFADEYEEATGKSYHPGNELTSLTPRCKGEAREQLLALAWQAIGRIEAAWGQNMWLVFHHMGIVDRKEDVVSALGSLLMGCHGHGVGIDDDYSEAREKASDILEPHRSERRIKDHPCHIDDSKWRELAANEVAKYLKKS